MTHPKLTCLLLLSLLTLSMSSCRQSPRPADVTVLTPSDSVSPSDTGSCTTAIPAIRSVDVPTFARALTDSTIQLLDVRTPREHTAGHIPHSLLCDVKAPHFLQRADSLLDKRRPVAVYCRSGRRSKSAAQQLSRAGYTVIELDGGYNAWLKHHVSITLSK